LVGEVVAREIGSCVLEVDDNQLLVFVCRLQQRRFCVIRLEAEDVSILGLEVKMKQSVLVQTNYIRQFLRRHSHHCVQRPGYR
jgi:hypothetical protein